MGKKRRGKPGGFPLLFWKGRRGSRLRRDGRVISPPAGRGSHPCTPFKLKIYRQSRTLAQEVSFTFSALTDTPVFWNIHIIQLGAANTMVKYEIEYEQ